MKRKREKKEEMELIRRGKYKWNSERVGVRIREDGEIGRIMFIR